MMEIGGPPWDVPAAIWAEVWRRLAEAAAVPGSAWRTPVLATAGRDGPDARTVVLRELSEDARELTFYTDRRSPKVAQIAQSPGVCWVFYDPATRVQLRVRARAIVENESTVLDAAWSRLAAVAQQEYLAPLAAGAPCLPPGTIAAPPEKSPPESGRENFAVIRSVVEQLDVLQLRSGAAHVRIVFDCSGREWKSAWVTP